MTTVTISGTISSAYKLHAPISVLSITGSGYIEGGAKYGLYALNPTTTAYTLLNDGRVKGGRYGVSLGGGSITNGSVTDTKAMIEGHGGVIMKGAQDIIRNYATITSIGADTHSYGLDLELGGAVTNGAQTDLAATIYGHAAAVYAAASVSLTNYGAIVSQGGGVVVKNAAGVIGNYGTVASIGTGASAIGISMLGGGKVTNGSTTDKAATIDGYAYGVIINDTITNYGTIESRGAAASLAGIDIFYSGAVINGALSDKTALISGSDGIQIDRIIRGYGGAPVENFGTVVGTNGAGVFSGGYTYLVNGPPGDTSALIEGGSGVVLARGIVENRGTIIGLRASTDTGFNTGVSVEGGGGQAPPSLIDNHGFIEGVDIGARIYGTLSNFGTIEASSASGYSVELLSRTSTLKIQAGSKLIGKASGDGGTIDLVSGSGSISRLGGGSIVSGGVDYLDFGTLDIGKSAAFTLTSSGALSSGGVELLDVIGTLDIAGALIVTGALIDTGHIGGTGHLEIEGGTSIIGTGAQLALASIAISGASTVLKIDKGLTFAGAWTQTAAKAEIASGVLKLTGAGDKLSGTLAGAGTVALTGAGDQLSALTLTAARTVIDASSAKLSGVIEVDGVLAVSSPDVTVSGVAQFTGGGLLQLARLATNEVIGASSVSLLENSDEIEGGGQLGAGRMRLNNEAGGTIFSLGGVELIIDTGANQITNAGLIEASGAGVMIESAIDNTGTLATRGGNITVQGDVTGTGMVSIDGATASFGQSFDENVAFMKNGELSLSQSQAYSGTITGFSKIGAAALDLEDISFAGAKTSYSGTTAAGVLTVTDGTHTARIHLTGNYSGVSFTIASDGGAGVVVAALPTAPAVALFASAISAFSPAGRAAVTPPTCSPDLRLAALGSATMPQQRDGEIGLQRGY